VLLETPPRPDSGRGKPLSKENRKGWRGEGTKGFKIATYKTTYEKKRRYLLAASKRARMKEGKKLMSREENTKGRNRRRRRRPEK